MRNKFNKIVINEDANRCNRQTIKTDRRRVADFLRGVFMFYKKIAAVVMSVVIAGSVPCTVFADTDASTVMKKRNDYNLIRKSGIQ